MMFAALPWCRFPGTFQHQEVYRMAVSAASVNHLSHFVEVGAGEGRSGAFLATLIRKYNKPVILDLIENWGELRVPFLERMERAGLMKLLNPIDMVSPEASDLYGPESLNMVYLDLPWDGPAAPHLKAWWPKLKLGGMLAGSGQERVKNQVAEFIGDNRTIVRGNSFILIKTKV